jgi:acetate kinase
MAFLILNAGSSSLKFSVIDHDDGSAQLCGSTGNQSQPQQTAAIGQEAGGGPLCAVAK